MSGEPTPVAGRTWRAYSLRGARMSLPGHNLVCRGAHVTTTA
jgi:hypothetical protein